MNSVFEEAAFVSEIGSVCSFIALVVRESSESYMCASAATSLDLVTTAPLLSFRGTKCR